MKRALSDAFIPPAAIVPAHVRAPGGVAELVLDGKIDTGSDLCVLPLRALQDLQLSPARTIRVAGYTDQLAPRQVYLVDLMLGTDLVFHDVEAVLTVRPYMLIGRNVLQHLALRIDGPRKRLELRR